MIRRAGRRLGVGAVVASAMLWLGGCAGSNEIVNLDLHVRPMPQEVAADETVKIVVEAFQDERPDQSRLGLRTHVGGGATHFNVPGGKPGEAVAEALADYLRHKGWQVGVKKPGLTAAEGRTDILLSGSIRELWATAKSRFFSTKLAVKSSIVVKATNAADGSSTSITLDGAATDSVWFFTPAKLQDLTNSVLKDSFHKLMIDSRIENRSWRLRN
ncbi:hypothetical protein YTPLAS18_06450 [Nitrospira sp.]|nr:hypothetical protein YTPLAS18_06450 [Nitrospira sp.]